MFRSKGGGGDGRSEWHGDVYLHQLLGMALIMGGTMYLLPRLGMVWTSVLCF